MRAPRPKLEVTLIMNRFIYKTNRVFDLDASRRILPTLAWKNQFLFENPPLGQHRITVSTRGHPPSIPEKEALV